MYSCIYSRKGSLIVRFVLAIVDGRGGLCFIGVHGPRIVLGLESAGGTCCVDGIGVGRKFDFIGQCWPSWPWVPHLSNKFLECGMSIGRRSSNLGGTLYVRATEDDFGPMVFIISKDVWSKSPFCMRTQPNLIQIHKNWYQSVELVKAKEPT